MVRTHGERQGHPGDEGGKPARTHSGCRRARPPARVQLVGTGEGTDTWGRARPTPGPRVHGPCRPVHGPSGETRSPGPAVKGWVGSGVLDLGIFGSAVSRVCPACGQGSCRQDGCWAGPTGASSPGPQPLPPPPAPRRPPRTPARPGTQEHLTPQRVCVFITTEPSTDGYAF